MHVDVDLVGWHDELQKSDRVAACEQQSAIGLRQGVLQGSVADVAAVEEDVLMFVAAATVIRIGHIARDADRSVLALDPNQRLSNIGAEEPSDSLADVSDRRQIKQRAVVVGEGQVYCGMRQRNPCERFGGVSHLRLCRAEELTPYGCVVEQIPNFHGGAHTAAARLDVRPAATDHLQFGAGILTRHAAPQPQMTDLGNRRQRFPSKSHRVDAEQIVGITDLAGGMAGNRQGKFFRGNPMSVVDDANQLVAALSYGDIDSRRAGIDGVLDQFLDDAQPAARSLRPRQSC